MLITALLEILACNLTVVFNRNSVHGLQYTGSRCSSVDALSEHSGAPNKKGQHLLTLSYRSNFNCAKAVVNVPKLCDHGAGLP